MGEGRGEALVRGERPRARSFSSLSRLFSPPRLWLVRPQSQRALKLFSELEARPTPRDWARVDISSRFEILFFSRRCM